MTQSDLMGDHESAAETSAPRAFRAEQQLRMGTNETMNALTEAVESMFKPIDFDGLHLGIPDLKSLAESTKEDEHKFDFGEVNPLPPLAATPWTKPR